MLNNIENFRVQVQRVLPTVYDDSLSYYELLNKVVHYLNQCIDQVNLLTDGFDLVLQQVVPETVENKLNQWYEDGTLESLINIDLLVPINAGLSDLQGKIEGIQPAANNVEIKDRWRESEKIYPITYNNNASEYNVNNYGASRITLKNHDGKMQGVISLNSIVATPDTGGDLCVGNFRDDFLPEKSLIYPVTVFNTAFTETKSGSITVNQDVAAGSKTPLRVTVSNLTTGFGKFIGFDIPFRIPYKSLSAWYTSNFATKLAAVKTKASTLKVTQPFLICTDPHFKNVGDMTSQKKQQVTAINHVNENLNCDFAVIMGDYLDDEFNNTKVEMFTKCEMYRNILLPNTLIMRGNHDENSIYNAANQSKMITSAEFWDATMEGKTGIVVDREQPKGCYFYRDDNAGKIRHIMLNTTDLPYTWNGTTYDYKDIFAVRTKQLQWLSNVALKIPTGWEVIIYMHNGLKTGMPDQTTEVRNGDVILKIIDNFKTGVDLPIVGTDATFPVTLTTTFAAQGPRTIIACIFGHMHQDLEYTINGVKHVGVDSILPQYGRAVTGVQSIVIDVAQVDRSNRTLYLTRFGNGSDRVITY